ncbi:hypothetical protein Tco_0390983, partial [Tanacetum coccineum]
KPKLVPVSQAENPPFTISLVIDTLLTNESTNDLSEEEVVEAMEEPTMEEYMMKTQKDYGLGIAKPKIDDKAHFELKGQFLKELRDNTFSGLDNEE